MKIKKLLISAFFISISSGSFASDIGWDSLNSPNNYVQGRYAKPDYQCVQECIERGHPRDRCQRRCSY